MSLGESLQLLVELLHRPLAGCLYPTPYGPWADGVTAVPAQQPGRGRKRHKDGQGTSQGLELPAGPLMRLHPQRLIQGRHLRDDTAPGTAADPSSPLDRSKQAGDLARSKALTPQRGPACRAGGPGEWTTGAFSQHGFDEVDSERAGHLPRRQDQRGQGVGVFDRTQKTLHSGIIVAYAVVKA